MVNIEASVTSMIEDIATWGWQMGEWQKCSSQDEAELRLRIIDR